MRQWTSRLLVCLIPLLGGCHRSQSSHAITEKSISTRPIVAMIPVTVQSNHGLSWNLSNELTQAIRQQLTQRDHLYLISEDQVDTMARKQNVEYDPFGLDIGWVKKAYPQNEFVVFFELAEHREVLLQSGAIHPEKEPAQLNITMKVRAIDLREENPKVVLQEVIEQSHHIPRQFTTHQVNQVPWGNETFEISPLGLAHEKLCQEVSSRVEDYILLNCEKR